MYLSAPSKVYIQHLLKVVGRPVLSVLRVTLGPRYDHLFSHTATAVNNSANIFLFRKHQQQLKTFGPKIRVGKCTKKDTS